MRISFLGEEMSMSKRTGEIRRVSSGDEIFATGRLVSDGGTVRLDAIGHGLYDQFIRDAGGISVVTDLSSDLVSEDLVTVHGIWTGESIRNAGVVDLVDLIYMSDRLGDWIKPEIVPDGRLARKEILAPTVLGITKELSDENLLFYCAYKLTEGWIGMACATDSRPVEQALRPILRNALVVVEVDWTAHDLRLIDGFFAEYDFADGLLSFGKFMDPVGRFKSYALVRMITPEMASTLSPVNPNALNLTSWIQKA